MKFLHRYNADTDKEMQILKFVDTQGTPIGVISWYAVHATSMNNTNRIISGDNKGYASYLFEQNKNPSYMPGKVLYHTYCANPNRRLMGECCD